MALTQPFFNTINAFDATASNTIYLNVLGGDAITSISFSVYENNSGSVVYQGVKSVGGDVASSTIRSFALTIPANALQNNFNYKITATTSNVSDTSQASEYQIFACYVTPSFSIRYYNGSNMVNLSNAYTIPSSSLTTYVGFLANDGSSPALLRKGTYNFYGITQQNASVLITSYEINGANVTIGAPTQTTDYSQAVVGFAPTEDSGGSPLTTSEYKSYTIELEGETTDGMAFSTSISGIGCYYATSSAGDVLSLENNGQKGYITVTVDYSGSLALITSYALQYKLADDANWVTVLGSEDGSVAYTFSPNFYIDFYYCGNNQLYNFRLQLFQSDGTVISSYTADIFSQFCKSYICDGNTAYDITKEWSVGSYATSNQNAVYAPFNSVYPIVVKNTQQKYRSGSCSAVLLANTSMQSAHIDRMAQVQLKNEFENWLSNGNAKILKTLNGDLRVVSVADAISSEYYKELANGIAQSNFSWTEVGNIKTDLPALGLTNNININII